VEGGGGESGVNPSFRPRERFIKYIYIYICVRVGVCVWVCVGLSIVPFPFTGGRRVWRLSAGPSFRPRESFAATSPH